MCIRDSDSTYSEAYYLRAANYAEQKKYNLALEDFQQAYTCLLYTSPSPRDRTRSRMPSSA